MREMLEAGKEIDPILLAEHLRDKSTASISLIKITDIGYGIPCRLPLDSYIKRVKEKAR
jgi:hypothetical protein